MVPKMRFLLSLEVRTRDRNKKDPASLIALGKKPAGQTKHNGKYSKRDVEFMNSLSGALLASNSSRLNLLLYVICLVVATAITWSYFAELDVRTRGIGRTIPSRQIQVVQNLEGGIVEEIHVVEGQFVNREISL